ncbi:hypothetical protein AB0E27_14635 [Streptomyces sparsogenes]|uniref:hypothetical protein n=1 Tax=Streptomyces sparsogenes TaxID=67365 RepID=UPI0033CB0EDC
MNFGKSVPAVSAVTGALFALGAGAACADAPGAGVDGKMINKCRSAASSVANAGNGGAAGGISQQLGASEEASNAATNGSDISQSITQTISQSATASESGTFTGGAGGSATASGAATTRCSNTIVYVIDGRSFNPAKATGRGSGRMG